MIDSFLKLLLGMVIAVQKSELKLNPNVIELINTIAEIIHSIIL